VILEVFGGDDKRGKRRKKERKKERRKKNTLFLLSYFLFAFFSRAKNRSKALFLEDIYGTIP